MVASKMPLVGQKDNVRFGSGGFRKGIAFGANRLILPPMFT
jgi:hypothetical protein